VYFATKYYIIRLAKNCRAHPLNILYEGFVEKGPITMTDESILVWQHGGKVILRQTLVEDNCSHH